MSADDGHVRLTYNEIHELIGATAERIKNEFNPDIMIAIGGGGFFPARVLRTFLKTSNHKNIPIQAIGLALYEDFGGNNSVEKLGKEVIRTQWLDFSTLGKTSLLGKKILIVDEVDDTRTTLAYAVSELEKDIHSLLEKMSDSERESIPTTEFAIFVVHNKVKDKVGKIPQDRIKYFSGEDIQDRWVEYPWEQSSISKHDAIALEQKKLGLT